MKNKRSESEGWGLNKKKDISYEMIYKSAIFAIKTNCKAKIFIYNFLFIPPFLCKAGNNVAQERKEDKKKFSKIKNKNSVSKWTDCFFEIFSLPRLANVSNGEQ